MLYFVILFCIFVKGEEIYSCVYRNNWIIQKGKTDDAIAFGSYEDTHLTKGWGFLKIETVRKYLPEKQAFAAGFLEGYLTKHLIYDFWNNYRLNEYGKYGPPKALSNFLAKQYLWWTNQCKTNSTQYWKEQNLIFKQFRGLLSGYNKYCDNGKKLSILEMYYINAGGDLGTLNKLVKNDNLPKYSTINMEKMNQHEIFHECTAIVKILPQNQDIVFSHNTWRPYYAMMRIYKKYIFPFTKNALPMTFASSPGFLHSKDDFYILKSSQNHFSVMETTNSIFNNKLFKQFLTFKSVLSWQRILGSMYYAPSIQKLLQNFEVYNSGTYNNQWIVTDLNKFNLAGHQPNKGLLMIAEQIPGKVQIMDVTKLLLQKGYWASYNSPFSKKIRDLSGYTLKEREYGDRYSYTRCPRRRIFDREGKSLKTINDIKRFMLLNKFKTDPLTEGRPGATIAARYDLDESRPSPFGAVDCKIGSKKMGVDAWIYGAPSHNDQEPFCWSESVFADVVHKNLPDRFDFDWIFVKN
ncbi:hypothetical protein ENUP19_0083G0115 [Entamoeba nuttalli]|uniref:Phospholipase B-like n=2 Tax=Entamoeba nuttalli TaxID=412467 RepID=K2HXT3_ENTNP|nr:phospholipase B, putative [Entamoeba nuttalli P19]EKE41125.1 phospholipase B, putative [Entamoeba nuttalli P19]|eukprot:XP_008856534.1 phospholipase B, putative [Entamoeba nuttalli P19]